jgi:hypothetical protein
MSHARTQSLADSIATVAPTERLSAATGIPTPNTTNLAGGEAYKVEKYEALLRKLVTQKFNGSFYQDQNEQVKAFVTLFKECAAENPELTAKLIIYARCVSDGMRSINQFAAALLSRYASGKSWAKKFYSLWNRKTQSGGVIYRIDDMYQILQMYHAMFGEVVVGEDGKSKRVKKLSNAMKKAFAEAIETAPAYNLVKYSKEVLDVAGLVHPNPNNTTQVIKVFTKDGVESEMNVLQAIMSAKNLGLTLEEDTWEASYNRIGRMIAAAVKSGQLTKEQGEAKAVESKREVWLGLIKDKALGLQAAVQNARNILAVCEDGTGSSSELIAEYCKLISNGELIRRGKVMPYQLYVAKVTIQTEAEDNSNLKAVMAAIDKGIESSLPNLAEALTGRNLIMIDTSGSMGNPVALGNRKQNNTRPYGFGPRPSGTNCSDIAASIGAIFGKATSADVILFDSDARRQKYDPSDSYSTIAGNFYGRGMATYFYKAWELILREKKVYDRVIIISDGEDYGSQPASAEYTKYVKDIANPFVYSIDVGAYGTDMLQGDKVRHYYGFGTTMFDDISRAEFTAQGKIKEIDEMISLS